MSHDHTHHEPVAYSYNTTMAGEPTGHTVTIAPDKLAASIHTFKKQTNGQSTNHLIQTLQTAMLVDDDFGTIPGAATVNSELQKFITGHARVMDSMGGVLEDFVLRVLAAAQLGYETDPETRRQMAWARAHMR